VATSFIKIEDVRDVPSADVKRAGKQDKQIIYSVDMARRYALIMPGEDYTPEKARLKIEADEIERLKLLGTNFNVSSGG